MTDTTDAHALLAQIDPFVALGDGRRQLIEAMRASAADTQDLAEILGIVAAHDDALRDVAIAYAAGARDFSTVATPASRVADAVTIDVATDARVALFDAIVAISDALDEEVTLPWHGTDTWRMHLIAIAMRDGAHAHAILEATANDVSRS